jgi:hypothetical protein
VSKQKTRQQRRAAERDRAERLKSRPQSTRTARNPMLMAALGVVGVIVVFAALIGVRLAQDSGSGPPAKKSGLAPAAVVKGIGSIPASTFDKVGFVSESEGVKAPSAAAGTPLRQGGKPLVVYVGADYCPYCAAERWPFVTALSRFGTFKTLGATHSATADVFPNTATFSFHPKEYTSPYVHLDTVELYGNRPVGGSYPRLESPTALETQLVHQHDSAGSIPFIYLGGHTIVGSTYDPQLLAGLSMSQIASAVQDPTTEIGHSVLGSANLITASICQQTGGKPADVCASPGVSAAAKHLPSS